MKYLPYDWMFLEALDSNSYASLEVFVWTLQEQTLRFVCFFVFVPPLL